MKHKLEQPNKYSIDIKSRLGLAQLSAWVQIVVPVMIGATSVVVLTFANPTDVLNLRFVLGCALMLMLSITIYVAINNLNGLIGLPITELFSGLVQGGVIAAATFYVITLELMSSTLLMSVVPILCIALITFTQNICDIERDERTYRRSLPVMLGYDRCQALARIIAWGCISYMIIWFVVLDLILWRSMLVLVVAAAFALVLYLTLRKRIAIIYTGTYTKENCRSMLNNVGIFALFVNLFWALMLIVGWVLEVQFAAI